MEPAKIDWNRIESRFVEDSVYEHINAPKWVDFLALEHSIDDQAWFCRPDCKHPTTADDFFKTTPPSKLARSANSGGSGSLPLREWSQGDAKLKRRGQLQSCILSKIDTRFNEDSENQNPNFSTPPNHQAKSLKAAIKSSSEKKKPIDQDMSQNDEVNKPSLSARNLFAGSGRDILGHITDFCTELKKLATRARERENEENKGEDQGLVAVKVKEASASAQVLGELDLDVSHKGRKPRLQEKVKASGRRELRHDEAVNIPLALNLDNVKHKREERVLQIRTNPPSPQCFSAPHAPIKTTPSNSKAPRSRLVERGILQELKQQNKEACSSDKAAANVSVNNNIIDGRQARALDVFWFLKPCTLAE
ncbi:hypothetical protein CCACVL1_19280 [Corchorus capsularis]|uniref:Uncharacterized protein n=1 Tax=Corchorus capsularis TaxID=210143 RepID=A0A1R3HHM4_COCAP|nr:hypothetical protein CCACVL1_19280 [Corchorus capsularis]